MFSCCGVLPDIKTFLKKTRFLIFKARESLTETKLSSYQKIVPFAFLDAACDLNGDALPNNSNSMYESAAVVLIVFVLPLIHMHRSLQNQQHKRRAVIPFL